MAGTQAAPTGVAKMPPLSPGEFRFITNAITADGGQGNAPRRFRMVASSTITDLAGNTISLKALNQLRDDFRAGLPIFMDHDYTNVVDKLFGQTDMAEVVPTTATDKRSGQPIYDLIVGGPVNEPNPRAVQLHDSMLSGFKFGASIGAIVRQHKRDKETGGMLIDGMTGKEASVVGIAKNQRSWAYVASLAAADLPDTDEALTEDEDEEAETQVVASNGEVLQQWVASPADAGIVADSNSITITSGEPPVETADDLLAALTEAPETTDTPTTADTEEAAASDDTTPGGQEADAATPETAPTTDESPDPAIEQQADIEVEDVAQLVKYVAALVEEIGHLRIENADLAGELQSVKGEQARLADVQFDATETIRKVMELPLRRKAVGHVETLVARYPQFDPRVSAYIERATRKENE